MLMDVKCVLLLRCFQRNEKGESALHRACIEGSLRKVKLLIDTVIVFFSLVFLCMCSAHTGYIALAEFISCLLYCRQCFDTVGWAAGRASVL